jgi:hypothetical protein
LRTAAFFAGDFVVDGFEGFSLRWRLEEDLLVCGGVYTTGLTGAAGLAFVAFFALATLRFLVLGFALSSSVM